MIVGTIALISMLFFGGVSEYFLIDKLEKGVKQYVVDKERRKEITTDLKEATKFIKAFNKDRKGKMKSFEELNTDRNTSKEELISFFDVLMKDRLAFQEQILSDRVAISAKIKPNEWTLILAKSKESVEKAMEKAEKKSNKGKESIPFEKTISVIEEVIANNEKKEKLNAALSTFIRDQEKAVQKLISMNSVDNDILSKKDASKMELTEIANELNSLRKVAFDNLMAFHFAAKDLTEPSEWDQIMKTFNKELSITSH